MWRVARFLPLLWLLFLHGGQVTSQCHSPEEHHAGQPARPQSSAPQGRQGSAFHRKGPGSRVTVGEGSREEAAFCWERFGEELPGGELWPKTPLSQKEWDKCLKKRQ